MNGCEFVDRRSIDNTLSFQPYLPDSSNTFLALETKTEICLYIHIPFCTKKCHFCSIDTCQSFTKKMIDEYVSALVKEIQIKKNLLISYNVVCIHFGGGTPSLLDMSNLKKIINVLEECIPNLHDTEVVFEANPISLNADAVAFLASHTKLSLNVGIQTFDPKILDYINRSINVDKMIKMIAKIAQLKLHTMGIDLISNLPLSQFQTTKNDINTAVGLGINHFAIYPLRIESNSAFFSNFASFDFELPSDAEQIEVFDDAITHLKNLGFDHYSIFHLNYTGYTNHIYSRRQLFGGEWIGIGAGASSYYRSQICDNTSDIRTYIDALKSGSNCMQTIRRLTPIDMINREITYSLRSKEINKKYYLNRYGRHLYEALVQIFKELQRDKYMEETDQKFELTTYGILSLSSVERMLYDYFANPKNSNSPLNSARKRRN